MAFSLVSDFNNVENIFKKLYIQPFIVATIYKIYNLKIYWLLKAH